MPLIFEVKVFPSAGFQRWKLDSGVLKCYLKSPPQKGKANKELLILLSKMLSISQSSIYIIAGESARLKRIKIDVDFTFDRLLNALGIDRQLTLA